MTHARSAMVATVIAALFVAGASAPAAGQSGTPATAAGKTPAKVPAADGKDVARGRYLVKIAGCNDCHTPGYAMADGKVPEAQWLTGDTLGWRGPWGTTYPVNLRLYMQSLSEDEWVKKAPTIQARPPMPSYVFRDLTQADLRALYRYIRHAGPAGKPAPAYVPPDKEPTPPFVLWPAPPK
jgi:mono/diheme cytochrome c family protein